MVHPGGFEPPTARFVAEYSIQLSYGCIGKFILLLILIPPLKPYQVRDGASGRIRTSDRSVRSRVLYPAELRMHRETYFTADFLIPPLKPYQVRDGASGRIRTSDRSVRSRVLYPAELRMQMAVRRGFEPRMQLLTAYSLSRGAPSASQYLTTRLLRVLRRTCLSLIVAAWRTYYFLRLISQTIFPTLLSFAHFTLN